MNVYYLDLQRLYGMTENEAKQIVELAQINGKLRQLKEIIDIKSANERGK